jgi:hypothetical protein
MESVKLSTILSLSLLIFVILFASGCADNHSHIELGHIPSEITWNNNVFVNRGNILAPKEIEAYIGTVRSEEFKGDVYSIKGIDSKESIAVKAIGPHYIKFTKE